VKNLFIVLLAAALLHPALAQTPKNDLGEDGLKGKVRSVTAQSARMSRGGYSLESPQLSSTASYDEQGNLTEQVLFDYRGNISQKTVYKIVDGNKTSKTEYIHHDYDPPPAMAAPSSGRAKPRDPRYDTKYKYKYEGNKVERITYFNNGVQGNKDVSSYDEKGNLIRMERYTSAGELNFSRESVFDKQGAETEKIYYNSDESMGEVYRYTDYEFDLKGNWVKRKAWQSRGNKANFQPYEIQSRTITYYDDAASNAMAGSANRPKVLRVSGGKLAEWTIKQVNPSFPPGAPAGEVVVEITVDEQGNVAAVEGLSGDRVLIEAVIAAVRQWKFRPVQISGVPVKVIGKMRFRFNR